LRVVQNISLKKSNKEIVIYIGVETHSDLIRKYCINKGFSWSNFKQKVAIIHKQEMKAGAYILFKPPFLSEKEAIKECKSTILNCVDIGIDAIELRAVEIVDHSIQSFLWEMGLYQPAWFWSILEILKDLDFKELSRLTIVRPLISELSSKQLVLPYNQCPICLRNIDGLIKSFNEERIIPNFTCDCKTNWNDQLFQPNEPLEERLIFQYSALIDNLASKCRNI
jgi:radical SAM enzyme (TIGR01210 family)